MTTMICSQCREEKKYIRGGICQRCILRNNCGGEVRYPFTPELDAALRRAYSSKSKKELSAAIDELVRRTGFPRHTFGHRAQRQGMVFTTAREWTPAEIELLQNEAGEMPTTKLARLLKRTPRAVRQRLSLLDVSGRPTTGYSRIELARKMGVRHERVEHWIEVGWLGLRGNRITDASVERFLWDHMDSYRFKSCDEDWLKRTLNPNLGIAVVPRKRVQQERVA